MIIKPKVLFLADGIGGLVTAFFLGIILARYENVFGMPRKVLYPLSLIACVYAVYSLCCFLYLKNDWRHYLKTIAIANLIYVCLSAGLVIYFYPGITILGVSYFLLEILVISTLVFIEFKTVRMYPERKEKERTENG